MQLILVAVGSLHGQMVLPKTATPTLVRAITAIHSSNKPGVLFAEVDRRVVRLDGVRVSLVSVLQAGESMVGTSYEGQPLADRTGLRVLGTGRESFDWIPSGIDLIGVSRGVQYTAVGNSTQFTFAVGGPYKLFDTENLRHRTLPMPVYGGHVSVHRDRDQAIAIVGREPKPDLLAITFEPWGHRRYSMAGLKGQLLDAEFLGRNRVALLTGKPPPTASIADFAADLYVLDLRNGSMKRVASTRIGEAHRRLASFREGEVAVLGHSVIQILADDGRGTIRLLTPAPPPSPFRTNGRPSTGIRNG